MLIKILTIMKNLVYIYFDSLKELQSLPELLSIELDDTDQLITNYKKKFKYLLYIQ